MTGSADRIQQLLKENTKLKEQLRERGIGLRNDEATATQSIKRATPAGPEQAYAGRNTQNPTNDCSVRGIVVLRKHGIRIIVQPDRLLAEYESGKAPKFKEIPDYADLHVLSLRGLLQQAEQFYSELVKRDL